MRKGVKTLVKIVQETALKKGLVTDKKFVRNKASVDSNITKEHISTPHEIAFDSGNGIKQFFTTTTNVRIFDSIGKYLDPSPSRSSEFSFPIKTKKIEIDNETFKHLGYNGQSELGNTTCELSATTIAKDNYNYDITIYGTKYKKTDSRQRENDSNISNIFGGNSQKSEKLKDSRTTTADKISIIIGKGWGDKLQVFIAYIYKLMKPVNSTIVAVSTCDEIVFNLCCYFSIACFFTSTGVGNIGEGGKICKINKILHYDPEGYDPAVVTKKLNVVYNETKREILAGYDDFISLILVLTANTPSLSVNGTNTLYKFNRGFYDFILNDLNNIKIYITDSLLFNNNTVDDANILIKELKLYSVNSFIKEVRKGEYKLASGSNKYNNTPNGFYKGVFLSPHQQKMSFMNIGLKYFKINNERGGIRGGNPPNPLQSDDYIYFMNDYNKSFFGNMKGFKVDVDKADVSDNDDNDIIVTGDYINFDAIKNLYYELRYLFNLYYEKYRKTAVTINLHNGTNTEIPYNDYQFGKKPTFYYYWSEMMLSLECNSDYSRKQLEESSKYIMINLKDQYIMFMENQKSSKTIPNRTGYRTNYMTDYIKKIIPKRTNRTNRLKFSSAPYSVNISRRDSVNIYPRGGKSSCNNRIHKRGNKSHKNKRIYKKNKTRKGLSYI